MGPYLMRTMDKVDGGYEVRGPGEREAENNL